MTPENLLGMMGNGGQGGAPNTNLSNSSTTPPPNSPQAPNQASPSDEVMGQGHQALMNFVSFASQFPGVGENEKTEVIQAMGRYLEKVVGRMSQASQIPSGNMGGGESIGAQPM